MDDWRQFQKRVSLFEPSRYLLHHKLIPSLSLSLHITSEFDSTEQVAPEFFNFKFPGNKREILEPFYRKIKFIQ